MESKKNTKLIQTENRLVVAGVREWGWEKWMKVIKRDKMPVIRLISSGGLMYSLVTVVNIFESC